MKNIKQRIAAFLLAVMMTVSGMPIEAFAAETTNSPPEEVESVLRLDNNNKTQPLETEDTTNEQPTEPKDKPSTTQDQPAIKEDAPEEAETLDISEDKTSEDMDKQKASNDNTTEGDPEGTVTSKDGKTRITMFDVNWVGITDRKRVANFNLDTYDIKYQAEVKWAISGEREYKPGTVKINMTNKVLLGEKQKYYFNPDFRNMPVPKAVLKEDGSIDFNADYKKSDFVYIENNDNTISLINIITLQPGNHGNYTITYKDNTDKRYDVDSGEIGNIESSISVFLKDNETISKRAEYLQIEVRKSPGIGISKVSEKNMTWPLSDDLAPENKNDYIYAIYQVVIRGEGYFYYDLNIEDVIDSPQELVGYTKVDENGYINSSGYGMEKNIWSFRANKFVYSFIKSNDKQIKVEIKNLKGRVNGGYLIQDGGAQSFFIVTKIPKTIANNGEKHKWINTATAVANTIEKNPKTLTGSASAYIEHQDIAFSAPPGDMFNFTKGYIHTFGRKGDYRIQGGISRLLTGEAVEMEHQGWSLVGNSNAAHLTYDSSVGDANTEKAYGVKTYKQVLSDDYLFLEDDFKNPLTNEDIEVSRVGLYTNTKLYSKVDGKYGWQKGYYNKSKKIKTTIYGKETVNGEWIKLASFEGHNQRGKHEINNNLELFNGTKLKGDYPNSYLVPPSGIIRVKSETETNYHGLDQSLYVYHKTKPSKRIVEYAKKQQDQNKSMSIYNIGTMAVYDNDGNIVGIKGNSTKTPANDATLTMDEQEYGQEMYHDYNYFSLSGVGKASDIVKNRSYPKNDTKNKQFNIDWKVEVQEETTGAKVENIKPLTSGVFYDLLPKGVVLNNDSVKVKSLYICNEEDVDKSMPDGGFTINSTHRIVQNYKNTGRDLLVVEYSGTLKNNTKRNWKDYQKANNTIELHYETAYPWDSYKDYGPELRNLVAYESGNGKIAGGFKDDPKDQITNHSGYPERTLTKHEKEIMKDLNPDHDKPAFLYSAANAKVEGNTIANTGLTKHVKGPQDIRYTTKTKVKEGGSYSYRLRLASQLGTSTSNIVLYDTLEDYNLLKTDEDYGVNTWKGALESIDISQPLNKGIDAVVYYSTVPNLKIRKPDPKSSVPLEQQKNTVDLTDTNIWTTEKPDDLSKVTAIAVDLSKDKNGQPYVLKENESVVVNLYMKAPWDMKKHRIDPDAKAINEIYANTTVTTNLDSKSENELINTAYTAVNLEPVETEATIKAKKSYLDKEDKAIELKGDDFEFNLKDSEGKIIQTKTNDKDGNITFDPIKYHSWDVGEHTYTIEEVKGKDNKIAYDKHIETVKVKVERPEVSEIKASVEYDKDGSNFTNKEKKSASLQLVKLKADEEKFNLEEVKDKDGNLTSYKVPEADLGKTLDGAEYKLYKVNEGKEELVATLTTKNGISNVVEELEAGSYKLVETKAPSGYHLAEDALKFEITDDDAGKLLAKFVTDKGIEDLPSTGGRGTKIFIGIGTTLLGLMAGAMYLASKKKKQAISK